MVKAFQWPKRLEEVADLQAWLIRLGTNTALDVLRRDRRTGHGRGPLQADQEPGDVPVATVDQAAESDREQNVAALRAALATLDPVTHAVVLRRYQDNASLEEIAREFGLSVSTISRRIAGALSRLNRHMLHGRIKP